MTGDGKGFFPGSLAGWGDLIAKMGAGAVLVFGYVEYRETQRASRIERVQAYEDDFRSGQVAEARRRIAETLRQQYAALDTLQSEAGLSAEDVAQAKRDIGMALIAENPEFSSDLGLLIEFLDSVQTCIETKICEASVARANFASQADWVFSSFDPVIPLISSGAVDGFSEKARLLAGSTASEEKDKTPAKTAP